MLKSIKLMLVAGVVMLATACSTSETKNVETNLEGVSTTTTETTTTTTDSTTTTTTTEDATTTEHTECTETETTTK
jgi:protocadherin Fat 4